MCQIPPTFEPQPSPWLRTTVFLHLGVAIGELQLQNIDSERLKFKMEVGLMLSTTAGLECSDRLNEFIEDLRSVWVIFAAGIEADTISAGEASKACEAVKGHRFALLKTALAESPIGK